MHSINEAAEFVNKLDASQRFAAASIRALACAPFHSFGLLYKKVHRTPFSGKVVAVDGGIASVDFHGVDVLVWRSCAACFQYDCDKINSAEYFPSRFPAHEIAAFPSLDGAEYSWHKSLTRLRSEINCANAALNKFSPSLLLLDGSILPQTVDKPAKSSSLYAEYEALVTDYLQLYSACAKNQCTLAGVIKDSRGKKAVELLRNGVSGATAQALEKTTDSVLLQYLLEEGERSFSFQYSESEEHSVLRDFGERARALHCLYIKPAQWDRPLRVDYLCLAPAGGEEAFADDVAQKVFALSALNRAYAHPAALIEADLRAAVDPREVEGAVRQLAAKTIGASAFLALRRDSRPFR